MALPLQPHPAAPSARGMSISLQSRIGLNAANFFLAEVTGVVLPFLNDFLRSREWRYDSIGLATAIAGLGVFLMQSPAGFLVDRLPWVVLSCGSCAELPDPLSDNHESRLGDL